MHKVIIAPAKRISNVEEYYFSRNNRRLDAMRKSGVDVINLGIGSPDLPPADDIIETLSTEARKPNVHGYQSYTGIPELRKGYADWYAKWYGVQLNPDNEILPLIGSKEGIMHIMMAFINEGDGVLVPNPGYPTYSSVAKLVGAKTITYNLYEELGWQPNFDELEKLDLSGVKMMWVNYPNMPTGAPASMELYKKIIDFGRRHNILICNDNPYSFILHEKPISILSIEGAKDVAIELNSMSKAHNMAGWRFGMAASNAEIIQCILRVKSNMDSGVFRPMQSAAAKALALGKDWFDEVNRTYRERQTYAFDIMDMLGCKADRKQGGLFVWGRIPDNWKSAEALSDEILHKTGIFITPGFIFGSQGERFLRISLCSKVETLKEAIRRLKEMK
ncbi:MAG: aminotransferase class I/II-fold pyridoxal phosphate-dependent enzyme [Bacteroidales bacterium]|nr:aminotransferase class I/II-fold pyridoxal phosphate-dependent enzyme [Bacteroidales bacterium]